MIYKFSDFENIKEYNYYNLDNNYMLYENDYLSMAANIDIDRFKIDFNSKLNTIIKDKDLVGKIIVQTEALNLFNVSKELVNGTYTNWNNIFRNIGLCIIAIGAIAMGIRYAKKKQNNKNILEKVELGAQKLKDVINNGIEIKLKTELKGPAGVTLPKGTIGKLSTEIIERKVNNITVKNITTYFTPLRAKKPIEISSFSPSLTQIIVSKVKNPTKLFGKSWEFFKTHWGKFAVLGAAAYIVSYFGESIEALIDEITLNTISFDTGSSVADLRELQALATRDGKDTFIRQLKKLIEETGQFERDLGFSNDNLITISSDSFAKDSKIDYFTVIGNKPGNIGYLVSYLLAEQCYNYVMGNLKAIMTTEVEKSSQGSEREYE